MDNITPTHIYLRIFGICPHTFEYYRKSYTTICAIIVITCSLVRPIMLRINFENIDDISFVLICRLICYLSANFTYNLTVFFVWKNCVKYNQMTNYVFEFLLKIKKISNRKIGIQTNCLTIGYHFLYIFACIIGWPDVMSSVPLMIYHILFAWFFGAISAGIVYARYLIVIFNKIVHDIIFNYKIFVNFNRRRIDKKSFKQIAEEIDKLFWFREKLKKVFGSQITIYTISAPIQLAIKIFIVSILDRRAESSLKVFIKILFTHMAPDILIMIIFVNSMDHFGKQVKVFFVFC